MKCPYCNKEDCVKAVVYSNIEHYGNKIFNLPCAKCGKMIEVCGNREVKILCIAKSSKKRSESDF